MDQPMTQTPLGEAVFKQRMLDDVKRFEEPVERIYTDHVGIPTMGIGKALATRSNSSSPLVLSPKSDIEDLVRQGTGNPNYSMPASEYQLLRDTVAATNAGNMKRAQGLIPPVTQSQAPSQGNRFGFTLTDAGMDALAEKDIDIARNRALSTFRKQASALGWSSQQIAAYEADLKTSPQMLALTSMSYNGVSAPKATQAMLDGNVPEAYDQIVYQSNAGASRGNGIANRRAAEGNLFLEGYEPQSKQEVQAWQAHEQKHKTRLDAYRKSFPGAFQNQSGFHDYTVLPFQKPPMKPSQPGVTDAGSSSEQDMAQNQTSEDTLYGESGSEDYTLLGGAGDDTLFGQQQLVDAFTADDGQSDVLYKRTEDITEDEIEGVMKSDTYWESNDPDYLAAKEKVNAFYDLNYGTDPVERDATGRMIDSGPKRKIPTEASPAKAADGKPLKQALGDFAKGLSEALGKANHTDQVKTAQEAVNILNNRSQKNGNTTPQPMLAVDGQAGPKTRAGLRNSLVQNKASHIQESVALASFKPTVMKAAQSGTAQGLNQATGKSFGGLFAKPQAAGKPTKPTLGLGPTSLGRRAEQSSPQGYGLQIAVNFAAKDHGLFASKTVEPLKEDGIVGPKTEATFGKVAKEIGSDDMLDRIGQGMGLFG